MSFCGPRELETLRALDSAHAAAHHRGEELPRPRVVELLAAITDARIDDAAALAESRAHRRPRLRACVERWPECAEGDHDPRCCRFPKSCSATVYDSARIDPADLEAL